MKFTIYLVDDQPKVEEELKVLLGSFLTDKEPEKVDHCNIYFKIKPFTRVDEAIRHCVECGLPDIFIVDMDFSEGVFMNEVSNNVNLRIWGYEMLLTIQERWAHIPYFVLSGNINNVWSDLKAKGVTTSFRYATKGQENIVKDWIQERLQQRAGHYFSELSDEQKEKLLSAFDNGKTVDEILAMELSFENIEDKPTVKTLLIGFYDIFQKNKDINFLKSLIEDLLNTTVYGTCLVGEFNPDPQKAKIAHNALQAYLSSPAHDDDCRRYNTESFDILLELIKIIDSFKGKENIKFRESINKLNLLANNYSEKNIECLAHKLRGRRVALAFEYLKLHTNHFKYEVLASLLGANTTNFDKMKSDVIKNYLHTKLGISMPKGVISLSPQHILKEEKDWLEEFAFHAKFVRNFLDSEACDIKHPKIQALFADAVETFVTFSEYKNFLKTVLDNHDDLYPTFLREQASTLRENYETSFSFINQLLGGRLGSR